MEIVKKSDVVKTKRKQELFKLLKSLNMDSAAVFKDYTFEKAHSDRSILSRISKEYKIGFATSYSDGVFTVWKEKYTERLNKTYPTKKESVIPSHIDQRIATIEVGQTITIKNVLVRSSAMAKLRRHAREIGIKLKCTQEKNNVKIYRTA